MNNMCLNRRHTRGDSMETCLVSGYSGNKNGGFQRVSVETSEAKPETQCFVSENNVILRI